GVRGRWRDVGLHSARGRREALRPGHRGDRRHDWGGEHRSGTRLRGRPGLSRWYRMSNEALTPATHVIHASLVRPALFAGAEPAVVMIEASVAFARVLVVGFHVATLLLAVVWLTAVPRVIVCGATPHSHLPTFH